MIADLAVHHIERFILEEGHTAQRLSSDYGYDLLLFTYDDRGYLEPGVIFLQVKAAESFGIVGHDHVFDLDVRDLNLWMWERMPVVLILFDAAERRACWLAIQSYFSQDNTRQPKKGAKTVRVYVPSRQVVSRRAIAKMRDLKRQVQDRALGVSS